MLMRLSVLCVSLLLPSGLSVLNPGRALQRRSHARAALTLHAAKTPPKRRRPSRRRGRAAQHAQRCRPLPEAMPVRSIRRRTLAQAETSAHTIAAFHGTASRFGARRRSGRAERYRRDAAPRRDGILTDGTTLTATGAAVTRNDLSDSSHAATTAAAAAVLDLRQASRMHESNRTCGWECGVARVSACPCRPHCRSTLSSSPITSTHASSLRSWTTRRHPSVSRS